MEIPNIKKVNTMAEQKGIRSLVGRKMTKSVKFLNEEIKISKLSVSEVLEIQEKAKASETEEANGFDLLKRVVRMSAEGASELTDEDFDTFPMDELSKLSNEIMKYSGIGSADAQGK